MNRHDDELEQEIADKYIDSMDAPDLWGRIEVGLDEVDMSVRASGKTGEDLDTRSEKASKVSWKRKRRILYVMSGLAAVVLLFVMIKPNMAGMMTNNKETGDKSVSEKSVAMSEGENADESDMAAESYVVQDAVQGNDYAISDNETNGKAVSDKPVVVNSTDAIGDYPPMIMVGGVLYKDTYDMVDAAGIDETRILYAESYTDGMPSNDGEVNFDRNPSRNSAYVVCDDGSLIVKVEGNWYRFERSE